MNEQGGSDRGPVDERSTRRSIAGEFRRLILLSGVPLVAVIGLLGYLGYRDAHRNAEAFVRGYATRVSLDLRRFISDSERGLRTLAGRPGVQSMDPAKCDPGLADLIVIDPRYANVNVTNREGWVICGAVPPRGGPRSESRLDREWFQAVMTGKEFAFGVPKKGTIVGRWIVTLGTPVRAEGGAIVGAVSVSFDLAAWEPPGAQGIDPSDDVLGAIDTGGTIVMRYPEGAKWVGRNSKNAPIFLKLLQVRDGVFQAPGVLGFERIWAVTPIPGTDWLAYAGIRSSAVLGPPLKATLIGMVLAAAALLLAAWLAIVASRRLTVPISEIARATRDLAVGSDKRIPVQGPREISEVARELNRMIEARERAVEDLHRSETFKQAVLNAVDSEIVVLDRDGVILEVNEPWRRFARENASERGMPAEDLDVGANYLTACRVEKAGHEAAEIAAGIRAVIDGRLPSFSTEYPCHSPGRQRWFSMNVTPLGEAARGSVVVVHTNITGRRRVEELQRIRIRLSELGQTSGLDGLLQGALDAAEEATGSQIGFFHFVEPDQKHLSLQAWSTNTLARMCNAQGKGQHYPLDEAGVWVDCVRTRAPVIHNDYASLKHRKGLPPGHAQIIRELVVPIIRNGKITEILGVGNKASDYDQMDVEAVELIAGTVQDMVDRRRTEAALREREKRYAALVDATIDGFWILDRSGRILEVNDRYLARSGYSREELVGMRVFEIDAAQSASEIGANLAKSGHQGTRIFETVHRARDGTVWPVEISTLYRPDDGGRYFSFVRDISERKRLEEMHLQSQKLESLGTLAGGIAHDFNNILAAIRGNVHLAAREVGPDHAAAVSLGEIKKASTRAVELVRRIMAFARPKEPRRELVDLCAVVGEVLKLLRATLPAGVSLETAFAGEIPWVLADAAQVHEAVVNLTTNAAYAIGSHVGRIEYRLARIVADEELVRCIPGLKLGPYVCLTVKDNGCGMDSETLERVFDAFYTTKPVGEGTGLGLSMVHGTMRSHGGVVTAESAPGRGSRFSLYFPVAEGQVNRSSDKHPAQELPVPAQRVLYVDDEEALVSLAERTFSRLHSIAGFTDPARALQAFRARPHDFDIVVTDLSMPRMSGFEFARGVLALRPDMPVLMMTGYLQAEEEALARDIGIREIVMKPIDMGQLGEALIRLAARVRIATEVH